MKKQLPLDRKGLTHKATISQTEVYIRTGEYEDQTIGEVFITISKEGDEMRLLDATAICISIGLQRGVPLGAFTSKLMYQKMGTRGATNDPEQPMADSILDYLARWLDRTYPEGQRQKNKRSLLPQQ